MKKRVTKSKGRMKRTQSYHDWVPADIRWSEVSKHWELKSDYYRRLEKENTE